MIPTVQADQSCPRFYNPEHCTTIFLVVFLCLPLKEISDSNSCSAISSDDVISGITTRESILSNLGKTNWLLNTKHKSHSIKHELVNIACWKSRNLERCKEVISTLIKLPLFFSRAQSLAFWFSLLLSSIKPEINKRNKDSFQVEHTEQGEETFSRTEARRHRTQKIKF